MNTKHTPQDEETAPLYIEEGRRLKRLMSNVTKNGASQIADHLEAQSGAAWDLSADRRLGFRAFFAKRAKSS